MANEISTQLNNSKNYTLKDMDLLAKYVARSGLLGVRNEAEAFVLLMLAENEGINPVQAAMDYNVIQGKPAIKSQAALVRFQQAGGAIKYIKSTEKECTIDFSHQRAGKITISWTIEKASKIKTYFDKDTKKQHYLTEKDNWINYPESMLRWRCINEGIRSLYPACFRGLYSVEEIQDFSENSIASNAKNIIDIDVDINQTANNKETKEETKTDTTIDNTKEKNISSKTETKDYTKHPSTQEAFFEMPIEKIKNVYQWFKDYKGVRFTIEDKNEYLAVLKDILSIKEHNERIGTTTGQSESAHVVDRDEIYTEEDEKKFNESKSDELPLTTDIDNFDDMNLGNGEAIIDGVEEATKKN